MKIKAWALIAAPTFFLFGADANSATSAATSVKEIRLRPVVMALAHAVAKTINATGGYRPDGFNDCYGFVRRTWDPILKVMRQGQLPVQTDSSRWLPIRNWGEMLPGDVLGTGKGHVWGPNWDGGLFAYHKGGTSYVFSNGGPRGAHATIHQNYAGWYRYYYRPTHELLVKDRFITEAMIKRARNLEKSGFNK